MQQPGGPPPPEMQPGGPPPGVQEPGGPPPGGHGLMAACRPDLAQFCGQVQPGGGRIRSCMKQHFGQLSHGCKQALIQARGQQQ
jgi:Cysteine rich repeat